MGGWNEGSERYSRVVGDPVRRTRLVNSIYDFLIFHGFDGFDFDWEYPARRGGVPNDYVCQFWCDLEWALNYIMANPFALSVYLH